MIIAVAGFVHLLAVVVWVGGMFFAHMALRPSLALLEPPLRLPLMAATLGRFFGWVAAAVAAIVGSGWGLIAGTGGMAAAGLHVHLMTVLGLVMAAVFVFIRVVPYPRLVAAAARQDWPRAAAALATIRRLVALNLALGLVTIGVAVLGRGTT
ncbi:MAG: CopD family protein [Betaproteobacteria bacterium]|nr:CopD family protein [Betaproteobacteria bacterium]